MGETMRRFGMMLVTIAMGTLLAASAPASHPEPLPTRWTAPPGIERLPHEVWPSTGPFIVEEMNAVGPTWTPGRAEQGRVAIIVENALYGDIGSSLTEYQTDLASKGYGSITSLVDGGTPEDLRTYLIGLYGAPEGLVGVVFVGNVPYIIYELMQDWDGAGGDPAEYEDFPCDLFFMDMDGDWYDNGAGGTVGAGNGKYDVWDDPADEIEIWAGRMRVDTLPQLGDPEDVLNNYFLKNHSYRTGTMPAQADPAQGLIYVDDDWGNMVGDYHGDAWCMRQVYGTGNVTSVFDLDSNPGNDATASDYKTNHLPLNYQMAFLRSHGYPGGHGFYEDYRNTFGWVTTSNYRAIDPPALFYSMFVCSGCDYTAEYGGYASYVGGTAAFNQDAGLVSWGSAKTGGMWNDEDFYSVLAEPNAFGPAFVNWFNASHAAYAEYAPRWWYGMVLIGDPTLIPNGDYFAPQIPASLVAVSGEGQIDVCWRPSADADLDYYALYRGTDRATPSFLDSIDAPDTAYADVDVEHGTTYTYWVTAVDNLNNESDYSTPDTCTYFDPTAVVASSGVPVKSMLWNRPNPFNPSTEIRFSVERDAFVALHVFDVHGRCVRTLVRQEMERGTHFIVWDGTDDRGIPVGSGIYLSRLEADGRALTRKMLLLK